MTITLMPEQQAWIDVHVARGDYASAQDAARSPIVEHAAFEVDDLAWAKPLVDEALAEIERGELISREDYRNSVRAFLASLRGK